MLGYVKREHGGNKAEELNGFAGKSEMKRISIRFKKRQATHSCFGAGKLKDERK